MYKQVIVVRSDLKLSKGKLAVHVAHASLSAAEKADKKIVKEWKSLGQKKVVVKVVSLKDLLELSKMCKKLRIPHILISDAGLTHLESGTITCLGIGPDEEKKINKVTGTLKLL